MGYAVKQDMIDNFGADELLQLTDRGNTGSIDDTVLNKALTNAAARIDAYLAPIYPLPLSQTYPILVLYACDIARYDLYDSQANEQVTKRYSDAIRFLEMVGQGKLSLGANPVKETSVSGGVKSSASTRIFNASTLADY
jgi:phage gp36-like protein